MMKIIIGEVNTTRMKNELPILVVEDQAEELELIRKAFSFHRINNPLVHTSSLEGILDYLNGLPEGPNKRKSLPGLIILDFYLEQEIALAILKALKAHPVYLQIPVVIFSTSTFQADMEACYALGCNGYFQKPDTEEGYYKIIEIIYNFWFHNIAVPYVRQTAY